MADALGEEREHVSPDSSTQVLKQEKRKHSKKKKQKHKSKKRKHRHSYELSDHEDGGQQSSSSSPVSGCEERQDTTVEDEFVIDIKPLNDYIDDRTSLNTELFKILDRKEIKKLMPKSVKKLDLEDLKSRCLDLLEVMSKKRLLKLISGEEMVSSSSESEPTVVDNKATECMEVVTTATVAVESINESPPKKIVDAPENILEELSVGPDQREIDELVEGTQNNVEKSQDATDDVVMTTDTESFKADRCTESQIMELEFRARALKSLMKAQKLSEV